MAIQSICDKFSFGRLLWALPLVIHILSQPLDASLLKALL